MMWVQELVVPYGLSYIYLHLRVSSARLRAGYGEQCKADQVSGWRMCRLRMCTRLACCCGRW